MKNKKSKLQISVSQKIISEYAEKIIMYMKENKSLKAQLEDLRITLKINKEMLNKQIKSLASNTKVNIQLSQIISSLENENVQISNRNIKLYNENLNLEKKLYECQQELNDKIRYYEDLLKELDDKIFILENKNIEQENQIKLYKDQINKYYKDDLNSNKEIYICTSPDQFNIEMNNELYETRQIITKYSHLLNDANKLNNEYSIKISMLKEIIHDIKKGKRIKRNLENIETFDYILTQDSNSSSSSSSNKDSTSKYEIDSNNNICDSPLVQCPSKIKQKRYLTTTGKNFSTGDLNIPKLDLSNIINKYKAIDKSELDYINNHEKTIVLANNKNNNEDKEYIDKLTFKLKFYIEMNKKYKQKFKEQKQIISMLKNHCLKFNINNNGSSTADTKNPNSNNLNNENDKISINYNDGYSIENNVNFSMKSDSFEIENEMNIIINEINKEALNILGETNNYYKNTNTNK
jgi:hypothetical protein